MQGLKERRLFWTETCVACHYVNVYRSDGTGFGRGLDLAREGGEEEEEERERESKREVRQENTISGRVFLKDTSIELAPYKHTIKMQKRHKIL